MAASFAAEAIAVFDYPAKTSYGQEAEVSFLASEKGRIQQCGQKKLLVGARFISINIVPATPPKSKH